MTHSGTVAGVLALLVASYAAPPVRAQDDKSTQAQVADLQQQLAELQAKLINAKLSQAEMKRRLDQLERRVDRLSDQSPNSRSQFSFDPSPRTGSIRIRNDLDVPATVTIDGVSFVVRARGVRTLTSRPAGAIRYYVTADGFGIGPVNRSRVTGDETLTITVYDTRERE
jgi:hypothetical protein